VLSVLLLLAIVLSALLLLAIVLSALLLLAIVLSVLLLLVVVLVVFVNASSLKQQSECRQVAQFWHIILILSQAVFVVSSECRVWLAENQDIPILFIVVWPDRGSNLQFTKCYAITLITAPPMRLYCGYAN
jgi:hypothetical protein